MKASDGWWPGLVNQQQHTVAVCLSPLGSPGPSGLSDLWLSGSHMALTQACILEFLFTLAAEVVAEKALRWCCGRGS